MKWGRLKQLTEMLLSGDSAFPIDDEEKALALLEYAFESVAIKANVQCLVVHDDSDENLKSNIVRVDNLGQLIRRPILPKSDNEELDIDDGLIFAVARLMASFLSVEKYQLHYATADSIMLKYNELMESIYEYNQGR